MSEKIWESYSKLLFDLAELPEIQCHGINTRLLLQADLCSVPVRGWQGDIWFLSWELTYFLAYCTAGIAFYQALVSVQFSCFSVQYWLQYAEHFCGRSSASALKRLIDSLKKKKQYLPKLNLIFFPNYVILIHSCCTLGFYSYWYVAGVDKVFEGHCATISMASGIVVVLAS